MQLYVRGDGGLDLFPGYALKNKTALQQNLCLLDIVILLMIVI